MYHISVWLKFDLSKSLYSNLQTKWISKNWKLKMHICENVENAWIEKNNKTEKKSE